MNVLFMLYAVIHFFLYETLAVNRVQHSVVWLHEHNPIHRFNGGH